MSRAEEPHRNDDSSKDTRPFFALERPIADPGPDERTDDEDGVCDGRIGIDLRNSEGRSWDGCGVGCRRVEALREARRLNQRRERTASQEGGLTLSQ